MHVDCLTCGLLCSQIAHHLHDSHLQCQVNNEFWGTRTQHITCIALPLAIADHASIAMWNNHLLPRMGFKGPLSFTGTPAAFLIHAVRYGREDMTSAPVRVDLIDAPRLPTLITNS